MWVFIIKYSKKNVVSVCNLVDKDFSFIENYFILNKIYEGLYNFFLDVGVYILIFLLYVKK